MIRPLTNPAVRFTGALVALLVLIACGGNGAEEGERVRTGQPLESLREAPDFQLETLEGDSLTLADLSDRRVILMNFWASWCAPCRAEIPDLIALHEEYQDEGFMVLGVTVNDIPRDSREFEGEMEMTYPSVIGTPAMLEDYKLSPWLPTTLLVQDGQVVREWVGPRSREEFEYPIRVALGRVPDLKDVVRPAGRAGSEVDASGAEDPSAGDQPGEPPPGAEPIQRPAAPPADERTDGPAGEAEPSTDP